MTTITLTDILFVAALISGMVIFFTIILLKGK